MVTAVTVFLFHGFSDLISLTPCVCCFTDSMFSILMPGLLRHVHRE